VHIAWIVGQSYIHDILNARDFSLLQFVEDKYHM
jgi:hypothetical protein